MPYRLIKQEGAARRGEFTTVHGTVQTPAFQNVATAAAIKGGLSALDLKDIRAQVMLCNTYHLHLRPGDKLVAEMGGLHKFTKWDGPILTDSGGFQVFSLAKLRQITEEGVTFNSHLDGHRIFMGPEQSMQIQANLGSTIAMAFDECVENPATYEYAKNSCARTARWLLRCKDEMARLKHEEKAVNPDQLLFGINQGCTFADLRVEHMKQIAEYDLDGYAIGGLAVGEPAEVMYDIISAVEPFAPKNKIRYLMGVGTPGNIIGPVLVTAMLDIGTMMMELAALSFLGLGAKPPIPEWGSMMSDTRSLMTTSPWITFSPGIAIFLSVMIFNLLGDTIRDYADPKSRR